MQEAEEQGQQGCVFLAIPERSSYSKILVEYAAHQGSLANHSFILVNALVPSGTFIKTGQLNPVHLSFALISCIPQFDDMAVAQQEENLRCLQAPLHLHER